MNTMAVPTVPIEEMRARIVTCGRRLLAERGIRAITTDAIATRARISKKTIYRCFAAKDELVEAVLASFVEDSLAKWDAALDDENAPAMERIERSLDVISQVLPQVQAQVLNQVQPGSVPPKLWARIDALRVARLARFKGLMEEAQAQGYIHADVDPDHWMLLLIGAVQVVLVPSVLLEKGISFPEIVRTVQRIYFGGLLTEKGRRYVATRRKGREHETT